ncbi:MAG: histidine--tRNA ligase [Ramlibacter sp.]
MSQKVDSNPFRGMRDILPQDVERRERVISRIAENFGRRGFHRIETPALERLEVLLGSEGGDNEKLIFKVLKRGEKQGDDSGVDALADAGLRYDLTVPLARYIAANHATLPMPFKAMQIGPVWRAERPQKGRFRQFIQCDVDILGMEAPYAEIDVLLAAGSCLEAIGLRNFTVRINHRAILTAMCQRVGVAPELHGKALISLDKLDKIGVDEVLAEIATLGADTARLRPLLEAVQAGDTAPAGFVRDFALDLDPAVVGELQATIARVQELRTGSWKIAFDPTLVRGMGYYTGAVFEVAHPDFAFSLGGGGRYDNMVGRFLGRQVRACGFSVGFERLMLALTDADIYGAAAVERVAVLYDRPETAAAAYGAAEAARGEGAAATVLPSEKKLGRQIERLRELGYQRVLIVGEDGSVRTAA